MFTYQHLLDACNNLGLDPTKQKNRNSMLDGRAVECLEKPFDLSTIDFPKEDRDQVEKIGTMIYNLTSQEKFPGMFNLTTEEGKQERVESEAAKKILPTARQSQSFWFEKGLEICGANPDDFMLNYNGKIYQVDQVTRRRIQESFAIDLTQKIPSYVLGDMT